MSGVDELDDSTKITHSGGTEVGNTQFFSSHRAGINAVTQRELLIREC